LYFCTSKASTLSTWKGSRSGYCVSIRQHTSAYVSIRQHTSLSTWKSSRGGYSRLYQRLHLSIRQHTSAYVSIRQHTPSRGGYSRLYQRLHLLRSSYLYFCTSKASKLSTAE
jgi:hypothetical protein